MKKELDISKDLKLPIDTATQKLAFLGTTGSGKTYGASKLAEEFWQIGAQFVVLDPVGVWYGLRLANDGKNPSEIAIPVFGGLHGDVPLESTGGELLANLVVDKGLSCIIDVSQFESDAEKAIRPRRMTDDGGYDAEKPLNKGAREVLSYLHSVYPQPKSKTQLSIATLYAPGGGFNNYIYKLVELGLAENTPKGFVSTEQHDPEMVDEPYDSSYERWLSKLNLGAQKVFKLLLENPEIPLTKNELAEQTGYAPGGGFNNYVYKLTGLELIKKKGDGFIINPEIYDL